MAIDLDFPLTPGTYQNVNDVSGDITGAARDITATRQTISSGTISSLTGAVGTTLPSSPFEGQEFYLQVQGPMVMGVTPAPQVWHLFWSGSGWDALGGSGLHVLQGTGGNSWQSLSISGSWYTGSNRPIITVPYPGIYDVAYSTLINRSTAVNISVSVGLGLDGNNPVSYENRASGVWWLASSFMTLGAVARVDVDSTIDMRLAQNSATTLNYMEGQLIVTPVRLEPV